MELSFMEILVICLSVIVLFGPKKIPSIARDLGEGVRKMRGAVEDIKSEILKDTDNPLSEIKKEMDQVKKAVQDFDPLKEQANDKFIKEESFITKEDMLKDTHEGPVSR